MTDDSVATTENTSEIQGSSGGRRRRWWILGGGAVVGVALVLALFLVQLPYFVIQPGSVTASEQRIEIEGATAYDNDGKVMFVTVFVNRATPALMIRSWLDESVEVRTPEEMFPNSSEAESRRENVIMMADSKLIAKKVALDYLDIPAEFVGHGALVAGLVESSPSEGILAPGDVIVEVDDDPVSMPGDIGDALDDNTPGETIEIVVEPAVGPSGPETASGRSARGKRRRVEVALGSDPKNASRPVLGIYVEPYDLSLDSGVEIEVDSGDVGGPSAGLAWTLGIIDRLTPGSLTSGRRVAVTGEIRPDGTVGAVGGTPQKVAAVKRAGIDVFLYPAATSPAEKAEIERIAGDDMRVYAVSDVHEAVEVLAPDGLGGD